MFEVLSAEWQLFLAMGGFVAFWLLGIPNALFWSFVMAVFGFLPIVGAFLVWGPASGFLFILDRPAAGIGLLLWGVLVISSVDNVVKPKLIAGKSELHPALALLGVVGGLAAFGFMGFLVGPLVVALAVVTLRIIREQRILEAVGTAPPPAPEPRVEAAPRP